MKRVITAGCLFFFSLLLTGQGAVGSWRDHLPYSRSFAVAAGGGRIYSSAGQSLLVYDQAAGRSSPMSRVSGLSETSVADVAWCDEEETLIVIYRSTGIDLIKKGVTTHIPDIKNKQIPGLKEINSVTTAGSRIFLSASFGIVVIDVKGRYVADTWRPGPDSETNSVNSTVIINGEIYAATSRGIWSAPLGRQGLSYHGNWERVEGLPSPEAAYHGLVATERGLMAFSPGPPEEAGSSDTLFSITPGQPATALALFAAGSVRALDGGGDRMVISLSRSLRIISSDGTLLREVEGYGWGGAAPAGALFDDGELWIADASVGLVSTRDYITFRSHTLPGPYTSNVADITFAGEQVFVTGGSVDNAWGNVYRPLQIFTAIQGQWKSHILYGSADRDAMRVVADPADPGRFFVSSWGNGLYEFREGEVVNNYNQFNSPLASIIPGESYSRICGLAWDRSGNLWMTQSGVPGNLKALTREGNWIVTGLDLNVSTTGDMVIDHNQYIWVVLPRGNGLVVYDPAGTPTEISDDRYMRVTVEESEGQTMNNLFAITADKEGNIWIGTDQGPVVYYSPGRVFQGGLKASRIKIARNDGSGLADYLLGNETVTAIAVDGANRKWFGTVGSGAYLMSDDGRTQLAHFNTSNSPLLSDNIVTIAVNDLTGEVWFGTPEGIISYRGEATAGKDDFSGLYAFPNPVREHYQGVVTITGLVENTVVKITDVAGNLVHETTSLGGQAIWDLKNHKSQRVTTGVYLIFCLTREGSMAAVTKLLVIR